jgi:hypothetical protein
VRGVAALLLGTSVTILTGCGQSAARSRPPAAAPPIVRAAAPPTPSHLHSVVARIDVTSDKIVAEGKLHIAAGAPSDEEVRKEIEQARKAGIVLPSGESAASFEAGTKYTASAQIETPVTSWNPRSKPIASWIVPVLEWAAAHGWSGTVTSGYRTYYEQAQLNAAGAFSAPAGLSNHETTAYPGGAVDVTRPSQLIEVLRGYRGPEKLIGGVLGPADPEHFSATGY